MKKRQSLVYELLYYVFDSVLIPLLRTNFYATETTAFRNRTIYFRQDDWNTITYPILEKLKDEHFTSISKNEAIGIMSGRDFGYSYVRLLPKLNGVRPIVNLRRRSVKIDRNKDLNQFVRQQQSINTILNVTFHIFNYEKRSNVDNLGSSVFGAQDIYEKMRSYKATLLECHNGTLPKLYFVKVDVACAFDSIDQEKLLEIVQDIICHVRDAAAKRHLFKLLLTLDSNMSLFLRIAMSFRNSVRSCQRVIVQQSHGLDWHAQKKTKKILPKRFKKQVKI